jgi:Protein of unknown function (DUF3152)/Divergent InlB B-repeat domain
MRIRSVAVLVGVLTFAGEAGAAAGPPLLIPYSVGQRPTVSGAEFREFELKLDAVLNDPRGWALGGSVRFVRVPTGGRFTALLAAPELVAGFGGCSWYWSCRSGQYVLINHSRWRFGTSTYVYPAARHDYHRMVINHEVGHALGFGHAYCSRRGMPAPVMQQQSKGLQGCTRNPWPLASERGTLSRWLGRRVSKPPPGVVLRESIGGLNLGLTADRITARLGDPIRIVNQPTSRRMRFLERLEVLLVRGRATRITARSPRFRTARGLGVGTSRLRLRARLSGERCDDVRCVIGRARDRGDVSTAFLLRGGRVVAVQLERLVRDASRPETAILSGPVGTLGMGAPLTFAFASRTRSATFECAMDDEPYRRCVSPHTAVGIALGEHTFQVRALDPIVGRDPTPALVRFSIADGLAVVVTRIGEGTVSSSPAGIDCGPLCTWTFPVGSQVVLVAAPADGWRFARWSGACSGIVELTCTLTVGKDEGVGVEFVPL